LLAAVHFTRPKRTDVAVVVIELEAVLECVDVAVDDTEDVAVEDSDVVCDEETVVVCVDVMVDDPVLD